MKRNIVVAMTGASGAVYAVRLLDALIAAGCDVQLSISPAAQAVLKQELGLSVDLADFQIESLLPTREQLATGDEFRVLRSQLGAEHWKYGAVPAKTAHATTPGHVSYHHYQNFFAPMASGSARSDGMVICPCSGGTLSAIAHGASGNLIHRAADVQLKERRKLILVPRETPLSLVQIDNMRRAVEAGAVVLPAMPGFYHGAETVRDLIDFVVARICDQLGVPQDLARRWGE